MSNETGGNDQQEEALPVLSGKCFCEKVVVQVSGKPTSASICHCSICRSLTGSPFSVQSLHRPEDFQCNLRESELWVIKTSKHAQRFRCRDCGSPVFASIMNGKTYAVPQSVFLQCKQEERQAVIKKYFSPTHHMYYSNRSMDIDDNLPKYVGTSFPGRAIPWTDISEKSNAN